MRLLPLFLLGLSMAACRDSIDKDDPTPVDVETDNEIDTDPISEVDGDEDGVSASDDCDDDDPAVFPGNVEVPYDGLDNDCDASTVDDDLDGDGALLGPDCNDADAGVGPGQTELCNGVDDDCNNLVDDAAGDVWYRDGDGDGYGDPADTAVSCDGADDLTADGTDCDDERADVSPIAAELCDGADNDCNTLVDDDPIDVSVWYADEDDDGFGDPLAPIWACEQREHHVADHTDCDDQRADVSPVAPELCDGADNDCNTLIDDDPTDPSTWYADVDGDGFGDLLAPTLGCEAPADHVADATDCDDLRDDVSPLSVEICDGADNDCNTLVDDEPVDLATWYADLDQDGFGDPLASTLGCEAPPDHVANSTDCDDLRDDVSPLAIEVCDGADNDCDTVVDGPDAVDALTAWLDGDGDGFGDPTVSYVGCDVPADHVADSTDCDDEASAVNPDAEEVCNDVDDDCDEAVDVGAIDAPTWYDDVDGDGHGDPEGVSLACEQPADTVATDEDCDDLTFAVNPDAEEVCNGVDDDCEGTTDEGALDALIGWADEDEDGYGAGEAIVACTLPPGSVGDTTDCDDLRPDVNPEADELCDGTVDEDCDERVDEPEAVDASTWYLDEDGDGFAGDRVSVVACVPPADHHAAAEDCDDEVFAVNPAADEVCNGLDDDCDETVDLDAVDRPAWYIDSDLDGYGAGERILACEAPTDGVSLDGDCDDLLIEVNPDADELCDGIDNDCDDGVDVDALDAPTWYLDEDKDGAGSIASATAACASPGPEWISTGGDCDDADPRTEVGAEELCNGVDEDCDDVVDDGCVTVIELPPPSFPPLDEVAAPGACARTGEMTSALDQHQLTNVNAFMDMLDGVSAGLNSVVEEVIPVLDRSARCNSDRLASPGNYAETLAWPALSPQGNRGASRMRGYLHIPEGGDLNRTVGLIANDAARLRIEGLLVLEQHWTDGRWKKFRWVSFPGPGLYAFEAEWTTNLICDIDPFELVWGEALLTGYQSWDTMCASGACGAFGNGVVIPGLWPVEGEELAHTSDGTAGSCAQCDLDTDCASGEACVSGLCE